jgi:hypothetical protein
MPADDGRRQERQSQKLNYDQLENFTTICATKGETAGRKSRAAQRADRAAKKRDDYLKNHMIGLGPAARSTAEDKMDQFDYSILGIRSASTLTTSSTVVRFVTPAFASRST